MRVGRMRGFAERAVNCEGVVELVPRAWSGCVGVEWVCGVSVRGGVERVCEGMECVCVKA